MPRTYGKFAYHRPDNRRRALWLIAARPHVVQDLKRIFPGYQQDNGGRIILSVTQESSRRLEWFMDLHPLEPYDAESLAQLNKHADQFRNAEQEVVRVLEGGASTWEQGQREPALQPRDYQLVVPALARATGGLLLGDDLGLGKAQPLDAPVLTPTGFRPMGSLRVGSRVIAADGSVTEVVQVFPQGEIDCYRVTFSDGATAECNDQHLWWVRRPRRSRSRTTGELNPQFWQALTLRELVDRGLYLGGGGGGTRAQAKWHVPMVTAPDLAAGGLRPTLDPYLLGALLGDGGFTGAGVAFTTADQEMVSLIQDAVPPGIVVKQKPGVDYAYALVSVHQPAECLTDDCRRQAKDRGLCPRCAQRARAANRKHGTPLPAKRPRRHPLIEPLRELGLWGHLGLDTFVPESYKNASAADRLAILQGLMDADGYAMSLRTSASAFFYSSSRQLAEDVRWLAESLGGTGRIKAKHFAGRTRYTVTVKLPQPLNPFRLARKAQLWAGGHQHLKPTRAITAVEHVGRKPMQCISIAHPSNLYVTDRFVVTHNSLSATLRFCEPGMLPGLVVAPTHLAKQWKRELALYYPWLTSHIITQSAPYDPSRRRGMNGRRPDILIVNYHKLGGGSWGDELTGMIRMLVCDEADELRTGPKTDSGTGSRWYTAASMIAAQAACTILATATPIHNYGNEIFNLIEVCAPGVLGTKEEFRTTWGGKHITNPRALGTYLRDRGLMLRRTRKDVGRELPPVMPIEQAIDTDHKKLELLLAEGATAMARLVLDENADQDRRFTAAGQLNNQVRHATGVAKAPFVAEWTRILLDQEDEETDKVLLVGWHHDCFAPGTKVLMNDGSTKNVEDVQVGDLVMGPDSNPRTVRSLVRGNGNLYRVIPNKGESWVCSENHILSVHSDGRNGGYYEELTARQFAEASPRAQRRRCLYRAEAVEFGNSREVVLEPWLLGYWLGDGAASLTDLRMSSGDREVKDELAAIAARHGLVMRAWPSRGATGNARTEQLALTTGTQVGRKDRHRLVRHFRSLGLDRNKRIPRSYATASADDRRELLAGLIDADGHVHTGGGVGTATFSTICPDLAEDVAFVARSLGLAAYIRPKTKSGSGYGSPGAYLNVSISGDLTQIPTRIERKRAGRRAGHKNVLRTGFRIEPAGAGDFYGFEVDGDSLFLLADFTVVHNCYEIWQERLAEYQPVRYTGRETPTQKDTNLDRFLDDPNCRVMLLSLRSGAGINGLEKVCWNIVFGELDWTPAKHQQVIGRCNRDGQVHPITAWFMVSDDGSDPPMSETLDIKRRIAVPIVDPDAPIVEQASRNAELDRAKLLAQSLLRRHERARAPGRLLVPGQAPGQLALPVNAR
ncbi:MAG: ATP-dependent helicase RecG [Micromonosporaceae bacterium]